MRRRRCRPTWLHRHRCPGKGVCYADQIMLPLKVVLAASEIVVTILKSGRYGRGDRPLDAGIGQGSAVLSQTVGYGAVLFGECLGISSRSDRATTRQVA